MKIFISKQGIFLLKETFFCLGIFDHHSDLYISEVDFKADNLH